MRAFSLFLRAKKWLRLAPVRQKGSGSQARALAIPKFNQRGNGRAVNVTPRNSKLEVQFRAFHRALFLRQEILPHFVSLHLVGTGDILLGGVGGGGVGIPFRGEYGNIRSCHGNWDGLRPNGLLGSDAEFTCYLLLIINLMQNCCGPGAFPASQ